MKSSLDARSRARKIGAAVVVLALVAGGAYGLFWRSRTVSFRFSPESASIEVDGEVKKAESGKVEISGRLGSVHRVRISLGDTEMMQEVIITEDGAVPDSIEIRGARVR